ncbi:hypothetical protein WMY93_034392 [Mugilogobius chulae]|uniref:Uncharacterized protein n=1 Tax=Mugilogobius chulae TaxID=88201 RepID=A0AAW0MN40_9GOBI
MTLFRTCCCERRRRFPRSRFVPRRPRSRPQWDRTQTDRSRESPGSGQEVTSGAETGCARADDRHAQRHGSTNQRGEREQAPPIREERENSSSNQRGEREQAPPIREERENRLLQSESRYREAQPIRKQG